MELITKIPKLFTLNWLTGPILDKELRVSSRRKRFYLLRAVYVALLLFFICQGWFGAQRYFGRMDPSAYMAEIGKHICKGILTMQFFGTHVVALFLLSGIFSEEIKKRTLGILLTTPINSFQLVTGKILSKLLQIFMLLCLSLPVLAIVRVFGGVPWDLIVYSTIITILGVLFTSSVIIFVSTIFTKPHNVFVISAILIIMCYSELFWRLGLELKLYAWFGIDNGLAYVVNVINPFFMLLRCAEIADRGSFFFMGMPNLYNFVHILAIHATIMILSSLLLLLLSAWRIRKVALKNMTGTRKNRKRYFARACEFLVGILPRISRNKPIRTVRGHAVVWKEMHNSFFRSEILKGREIYLLLITSIIIVHAVIASFYFNGVEMLIAIVGVLWIAGAYLASAIIPASAIVKEKETSSWQILMCTPLGDTEILWGKIAGIIRKSSIMWIVVLLVVALFCYVTSVGIYPLLLSFMIIIGTVAFFTGIGIYISVVSRNVSTAVMFTTLLGAVFMFVLDILLIMVIANKWRRLYMDEVLEASCFINPLGPLVLGEQVFEPEYFAWVLVSLLIHLAIGLVFLCLAGKKLRKKIF